MVHSLCIVLSTCPLTYGLDLARTKHTTRIDGPWPGPIFSRLQASLRLSEEIERYLELLASTSAVLGTLQMVSLVEESECESDFVVEEIEGISYDWISRKVYSIKSQYPIRHCFFRHCPLAHRNSWFIIVLCPTWVSVPALLFFNEEF